MTAELAPAALRWRAGLVALGVLAVLGFIALGTWQLERLQWKLDLIARVDARVTAPAMAAPEPATWPGITAEDDEYRHVTADGTFLNDKQVLVQAVTEQGPGFWLVAPLMTDQGFAILVNRGFVPSRDPALLAAARIDGPTRVDGLLRLTEPGGGFLRSNDPAHDKWYSRDVAAIAAADGLTDVAPYFIDAGAAPGSAGRYPMGGLTVVDFPNNHLVYALTWFALAALLAASMALMLWRLSTRRG